MKTAEEWVDANRRLVHAYGKDGAPELVRAIQRDVVEEAVRLCDELADDASDAEASARATENENLSITFADRRTAYRRAQRVIRALAPPAIDDVAAGQ